MKNNIYVDVEMLRNIKIEDCLEIRPNKALEQAVYALLKSRLDNQELREIDDDTIYSILLDVLLKLVIKDAWVKARDRDNFTQRELYLIIRKKIYFMNPDLI